MRTLILLTLVLLLAVPASFARESQVLARAGGNSGMGIAAVVGGDAISSYELDNRLRFIITTARMSNTPEIIERIRPQVIRSLIDERLQVQEATKNSITVSDEEVEQTILAIEQQRGLPSGSIKQMLASNRIPVQTFTDQIRAQVAWNKLVMKKIKPQIRLSDEEILLAARKFLLPPARKLKELKIGVIQLPVDKPSQDVEMRQLADKLVKEVRAGASYEEVSRQFSSSTASSAGKLDTFWVRPEQLDPVVGKVLSTATDGMVTDPMRTSEGYTIIKVYETRALATEKPTDVAVALKEIILKLKPDASDKEADVMLQIGEEVARNPGSCEEKGIASIDDLEDFDIEVNIINELMSDLPPAIKMIADSLEVGDMSTPFASNEGIRLYMLCDKRESSGKLDRDRVAALLFQQKIDLEAQKHLRNLRRNVYTDVR